MLSRLAVASLFALVAAGCASECPHARPGAAPLTDMEAARMGRVFLNPNADRNLWLHRIERQCDGYMIAYTTVFDPTGQPPKETHLIVVRDDGTVREIPLRDSR